MTLFKQFWQQLPDLIGAYCRNIFSLVFAVLFAVVVVCAIFLTSIKGCEGAEIDVTFGQIADAIWIIEGGENARQAYGIEGFVCSGQECRQISLNTIRNQKIRHTNHECNYTYLECLSMRYCPPNHRVWLRNLKFWINKLSIKESQEENHATL